ncbi:hypothetical protein V8F20_008279 [Naviculisporaceae sp. PSN 640]
MAGYHSQASNGYQDAADMAILGRHPVHPSSPNMRSEADQIVVWQGRIGKPRILRAVDVHPTIAYLDDGFERVHTSLKNCRKSIHGLSDKVQEGQRTIIAKQDKMLEALVRLKRPVHDDLEWERLQAAHDLRMMELKLEDQASSRKIQEIRLLIITIGAVLIAVLAAFRWA